MFNLPPNSALVVSRLNKGIIKSMYKWNECLVYSYVSSHYFTEFIRSSSSLIFLEQYIVSCRQQIKRGHSHPSRALNNNINAKRKSWFGDYAFKSDNKTTHEQLKGISRQ